MTSSRFDLVIFDCDGVLIDSEMIASRVAAAALTEIGWPMTPAEAMGHFLGVATIDMGPIIAARLGAVPEGFLAALSRRTTAVLAEEVEAVPGARAVLETLNAMGVRWRVASNSGRVQLAAKFARAGLSELVDGRVHSAQDVIALGGRGKPAPDLFLATAAAEGVPSETCLVLEDSLPGVTAAVAAGMHCLGFAPHGSGDALLAAGAAGLIRDLADLPPLVRARAA